MDVPLLRGHHGSNRSGRAPLFGRMSMSVGLHRVQSARDNLQNRRGRSWQI